MENEKLKETGITLIKKTLFSSHHKDSIASEGQYQWLTSSEKTFQSP